MSRARAPGKLVLSGAYAVLEGAPAIVAAVDRWVVADAARAPHLTTPEVAAALGPGEVAPWFDASALRDGDAKLGLGSSAAIVVASLAARAIAGGAAADDASLASAVLPRALAAHRAAQGGGSGVDVVASALGGVVRCRGGADGPSWERAALPAGLVVEAWATGVAASTPALVGLVRAFAARDPREHAARMGRLAEAAEAVASAREVSAWLAAIGAHARALAALGDAANAPIVTAGMGDLDEAARSEGGVVMPSGAGGGDVIVWFGTGPTGPRVAGLAARNGYRRVALSLGARGVHDA